MTIPNNIDPNMPPPPPGGDPSQPIIQPPASPVMVQQPPPAPQQMYSKAELEAARQAEAAKVHGQLEALKTQIATTQASNQQAAATDPAVAEVRRMLDESRQAQATMAAQINELAAQTQRAELQRFQAELAVWQTQRVAQYETAGYGLIREMIGGNSVQEIEASIQRAAAAFQRYAQQLATVMPPAIPTAVVLQQQPIPNGFPTAPNAPAPVGMDPGQQGFFEVVRNATHPDAVRNGTYAQNRGAIMASLRDATGGVNGQFSNAPRFMPQPGQAPPTTWQNVQQPQGRPTAPAMQPGHQQFAPQPQAPQWQPQPPQMPQYQQWQQPQPPWQPQQFQNPGGPVQPQQVDQGAQIDPAAARAHATATAQRHLANPNSVPQQFNPTAGQLAGPRQLGINPNAPTNPLANPNAQFTGVNPMIRNTVN